MNYLNLSPSDRVQRLIDQGVTTPGRLAQRARITAAQLQMILKQLRKDGKVSVLKMRSHWPCLLADVWVGIK